MIYHVTHTTWYDYPSAVLLCQNRLHLRPRERDRQQCRHHELSIAPTPVSRHDGTDFFGNSITWITLEEPHRELKLTATTEVNVDAPSSEVNVGLSTPWEVARDMLDGADDLSIIEARQFIFDSAHVTRFDELAEYARPSFTPGRPLFEAALDLTCRIEKDFRFMPGSTNVDTSAMDVLSLRRGVCQDFAHLQIGCLRSLGLPARYVSGYLATKPPPGQRRLAGADVSHAWVSVFDPGIGWVDFDPTNGLIPTDQHVTLAWARDYDEICPVRGITVGGDGQWMQVAVDVVPATEAAP